MCLLEEESWCTEYCIPKKLMCSGGLPLSILTFWHSKQLSRPFSHVRISTHSPLYNVPSPPHMTITTHPPLDPWTQLAKHSIADSWQEKTRHSLETKIKVFSDLFSLTIILRRTEPRFTTTGMFNHEASASDNALIPWFHGFDCGKNSKEESCQPHHTAPDRFQGRIQDFGRGGVEFWPQGGPETQHLLTIGVFP